MFIPPFRGKQQSQARLSFGKIVGGARHQDSLLRVTEGNVHAQMRQLPYRPTGHQEVRWQIDADYPLYALAGIAASPHKDVLPQPSSLVPANFA